MPQVRIDVAGRRYDIACREGGEERLQALGRLVDAYAADAIRSVGRGSEARELILAALLLADALDDARGREAAALAGEEGAAAALERCAARLEALADACEVADAPAAP